MRQGSIALADLGSVAGEQVETRQGWISLADLSKQSGGDEKGLGRSSWSRVAN